MTDAEISLIVSAFALGWLTCLLTDIVWEDRIDRREQKRAAALLAEARARLEADKAKETA